MIMRKSLVIFLILCFAFVGFAQAQKSKSKKTKPQKAKPTTQQTQTKDDDKYVSGPPPKPKNEITPEEEKEAKAFAELFIKRLRETRDLKQLIGEMFFSGFSEMAVQDKLWWGVSGLPHDTGKYINADERLKVFCDGFTIQYLEKLYINSKATQAEINKQDDKAFVNLYPSSLVEYWKSVNQPVNTDDRDKYIRFVAIHNEQMVKLWREELIKNPPEETTTFKENMKVFITHLEDSSNDWGKPFALSLDEGDFGLPVGTKFIRMEIPFHVGLAMAKEKGQMKVVTVLGWIPPD